MDSSNNLMLHWELTWVARLPQDSKVLHRWRWEIVVTFVCEANRPFKIKIFHMIFLISEFIWSPPMKLLSKDKPMKKLTIMKFYNVLFNFSSSSLEHEYIFYPMPWLLQTGKYILHLRYMWKPCSSTHSYNQLLRVKDQHIMHTLKILQRVGVTLAFLMYNILLNYDQHDTNIGHVTLQPWYC